MAAQVLMPPCPLGAGSFGDAAKVREVRMIRGDRASLAGTLPAVSSISTSTKTCRDRGQVTFSTVLIREYPMTLGDNPSCSYGAPVQLDWVYHERVCLDLDDYEATRAKRRPMRHLVLNYYQRCDILEAAGISNSDVRRAQAQVARNKRQRHQTQFFTPADRVTQTLQGAGSKLKKVFRKKKPDQQ